MHNYRVKDWGEFQHYKDRSPPWIRLHKRLLDNFKFHSLPDASRALAPMLWLLASENKEPSSGIIALSDEEIAFRLHRPIEEFRLALIPLIDKGFIELVQPASDALAVGKQVAVPETEAEAETDSETKVVVDDMRGGGVTPFQRIYEYGCSLFPQLATQNTSAIHQWLTGGADIEKDILPEIKRLYEKKIQPKGWGLFTQDVANAKMRRETPLPKGQPKNDRAASRHTDFAAQDYREGTDGFVVS